MKKLSVMLIALLVLLGGGALAILVNIPAPSVSFKFLNYTRWPGGAMLRLTNGTPSTITYLTEPNGILPGGPILRLITTSNGWIDASAKIELGVTFMGTNGKPNVNLDLRFPSTPPKPGESFATPRLKVLKPGTSVDFFIGLEPGASPVRIGTVCLVPRTRFGKVLQPFVARLRQLCGMKTAWPGPSVIEVWCPTSLQLQPSSSPWFAPTLQAIEPGHSEAPKRVNE